MYKASDITSEHDVMEYCRERVNTSAMTSLMRVLARGVADPPAPEGADEDALGVSGKYDQRTAGRVDRLNTVLSALITELMYKGLRPNTKVAGQLFQAQIASVGGTSVNAHALLAKRFTFATRDVVDSALREAAVNRRTSGWANVGVRKTGGKS